MVWKTEGPNRLFIERLRLFLRDYPNVREAYLHRHVFCCIGCGRERRVSYSWSPKSSCKIQEHEKTVIMAMVTVNGT